jgi:hypothetical protein
LCYQFGGESYSAGSLAPEGGGAWHTEPRSKRQTYIDEIDFDIDALLVRRGYDKYTASLANYLVVTVSQSESHCHRTIEVFLSVTAKYETSWCVIRHGGGIYGRPFVP